MEEADVIRAAQLASVEDVERQLRGPMLHIEVGDKLISREAAWAATQAIRACWDRGLRYDGQYRGDDGPWYARGEDPETGDLDDFIPLGRFPAEFDRLRASRSEKEPT